MHPVFKKLNYKDQPVIHVIQAPESFRPVLQEMRSVTRVETSPGSVKQVRFFLAFVTKQSEVNSLTRQIIAVMEADGILWFAYPKGTSKKYKCEFNRDTGWEELGKNGYEGVRMVAIDEDWSALRFRKAEHIRTMTRSFAMSAKGKMKVKASRILPAKKKKD